MNHQVLVFPFSVIVPALTGMKAGVPSDFATQEDKYKMIALVVVTVALLCMLGLSTSFLRNTRKFIRVSSRSYRFASSLLYRVRHALKHLLTYLRTYSLTCLLDWFTYSAIFSFARLLVYELTH